MSKLKDSKIDIEKFKKEIDDKATIFKLTKE